MSSAPPTTAAEIQLAARHLADGDGLAAIRLLEDLTSDFPAYVTAHVLLARAYESAGRLPDALQSWHRAYFLMPGSPLITRQRKRLLERAGHAASPETAPRDEEAPAPVAEPVYAADHPTAPPARAETSDLPREDDPRSSEPSGVFPASEHEREPNAPSMDAPEMDAKTSIPEDLAEEVDAGFAPAAREQAELRQPDVAGPVRPSEGTPQVDDYDEEGGWRLVEETPRAEVSDEPVEAEIAAPGGRRGHPPGGPLEWDDEIEESPPPTRDANGPVHQDDQPSADTPQRGWRSGPANEGPSHPPADTGDQFLREAGDLDSLIEQLESAPRIQPEVVDPDDVEEDSLGDDVVTETLARIYEGQRQFAAAARAYERLADEQPARAEEFRRRAAEMRQRSEN